jgi:hypothetical protein
MNMHRTLAGTTILVALVGLAVPAGAQEPAPPAPASPPEAPAPASPPEVAPAPASPPPEATPAPARPAETAPTVVVAPAKAPEEGVRDGVRLRGGFSINGGVFLLPANPAGGAVSVAGRIGVQFNHYLGLYYQNTPSVGANMAHDKRSGTVVATDYNSVLVNLTLLHMLEIGAGPSLDYVALAKGSITLAGLGSSAMGSTGTGVAAGGHARVAFNIGGLSGNGPRRSGFAIGVDAHPMFLSTGRALSLTAGVGAEWY